MWTKTEDGSVIDQSGKIIFFSTERFIRDICLGSFCFICGAESGTKEFNDEHVVPEWVLRRYGLFSKTIELPNATTVRYDRYKIPCCRECNALMGDLVETTISDVVRRGNAAINDFLASGELLKLFVWMGLIFLKTHLRDKSHCVSLDQRLGQEKIADEYAWEQLHHIHTVVRCFYTGCSVSREAIGSFLSLPVVPIATDEKFDFGDLYLSQTLFVRLGETALLTVFNDSGAAMCWLSEVLKKVSGPVSELQLREIMVELAFLNLHIEKRPTFESLIDLEHETHRIVAHRPELELSEYDLRTRGLMLFESVQHLVPHIRVPGMSTTEITDAIKSGRFTFLFDDQGLFIGEPFKPVPPETQAEK